MKKYSKKIKQKASALFVAIIFSFLSLVLIGGFLMSWYRYTQMLFPIKVYSSINEAAVGSMELITSYIDQGTFNVLEIGECPLGNKISNNPVCCRINIKYRLLESGETFNDIIEICLLGYQIPPGEGLPGVSSIPQSGKLGLNFVYGLNSTAIGPQNTKAIIEAVYLR